MFRDEIYNRMKHDSELQARIVIETKRIYDKSKSFQTILNWIRKKDSRLEHPYIIELLEEYADLSKLFKNS